MIFTWARLSALLAAIGGLLAAGISLRKAGADAQKVKTAEANQRTQKRVHDAVERGAHSDSDVDKRLSDGSF